jgi:uncharacterized repeat protein (TIGR01451 family)
MRRALWILSAPVVAGGLAWAVNAADSQEPLLAQAPAAKPGKVVYFSRSGKSGNAATAKKPERAADLDDDLDTDLDAESAADTAPPQRYVRNRAQQRTTAGNRPKNLYQDLFGENTAEKKALAPRRTPATTAATTRARQRRLIEGSDLSEAAPDASDELAREENPLPPVEDSVELVQGSADKGDVRHADHKATAGSRGGSVKHVQHTGKGTAARTRSWDDLDEEIADPVEEDAEDSLTPPPAPAPVTKPARPAAPTARAPARPAQTSKAAHIPSARTPKRPVSTRPPVTAKAPVARKPEAAATADFDTPPVNHPPIQQTSAVAADISNVPLISLKWVKNGEVNVGQECTCGLVVKNTGKVAAKDVIVEAHFPRTVRLLDAEPLPSDTKDHLGWVFENLEPGAEKTISIKLIPGRRGELATSATVRFTGVASSVLQVEEPQLSVAVAGPREVMLGESTTQVITVSNPGSGVAHDVVVHASIPEGLEHQRGKNVELAIGSLAAGEAREIRLPLAATAGGDSILRIEARGANLLQKTQAQIKVAAPKLTVDVAGPSLRYINRHAQYTITVTNDGVAATDNVRVVHLVPEGFDYVKSDRGGKYDPATASVTWFVGRLEAGQSLQVSCDLNARQTGDYQHHVQASGENGTLAAAKLETKVDGASAIVMEVNDLDDPVEIETQTAYEIKIRNDGSKAAQNLRLACELPAGVELIGAEGPSAQIVEKGILSFRPLPELAAGSKITYRIMVSGKTAGNLRLRAKLTTNASTEPLIVEELTKFYAD